MALPTASTSTRPPRARRRRLDGEGAGSYRAGRGRLQGGDRVVGGAVRPRGDALPQARRHPAGPLTFTDSPALAGVPPPRRRTRGWSSASSRARAFLASWARQRAGARRLFVMPARPSLGRRESGLDLTSSGNFLAEGVEGAEPGHGEAARIRRPRLFPCVRGPHTAVVFREISGRLAGEANALAQAGVGSPADLFSVLRHEVGNPLNSAKTALRTSAPRSAARRARPWSPTSTGRSPSPAWRGSSRGSAGSRRCNRRPRGLCRSPTLGRALEQARRAPSPEGVTLSAAELRPAPRSSPIPRRSTAFSASSWAAAPSSRSPRAVRGVSGSRSRGGESLGHVRISDEGNGMDEEEVRGLFRPREIDDWASPSWPRRGPPAGGRNEGLHRRLVASRAPGRPTSSASLAEPPCLAAPRTLRSWTTTPLRGGRPRRGRIGGAASRVPGGSASPPARSGRGRSSRCPRPAPPGWRCTSLCAEILSARGGEDRLRDRVPGLRQRSAARGPARSTTSPSPASGRRCASVSRGARTLGLERAASLRTLRQTEEADATLLVGADGALLRRWSVWRRRATFRSS